MQLYFEALISTCHLLTMHQLLNKMQLMDSYHYTTI